MMDDRVHPMVMSSTGHADDTESVRSTNDDNESLRSSSSSVSGMDSCLLKKKPTAHPGSSYVIQIPKDQIYRVPPPENAHLFDTYTRRANRGGDGSGGVRRRRRCLVWALGAAVLVLLALAVAAGALYLVSRPRMPIYTLDSLGIGGFNLSNPILSPEFDVAIRADNPNTKIGIDYRGGGSSAAGVAYSGVALARGAWPAFYQGPRNATVLVMALKGSGVRLSGGSVEALLREQQARGRVPLEVDAGVPARVKLGPVASWTFEVKVRCDVVVDRLGLGAKIVSSTCKANAAPRW